MSTIITTASILAQIKAVADIGTEPQIHFPIDGAVVTLPMPDYKHEISVPFEVYLQEHDLTCQYTTVYDDGYLVIDMDDDPEGEDVDQKIHAEFTECVNLTISMLKDFGNTQ
jgi:hypothetical protein